MIKTKILTALCATLLSTACFAGQLSVSKLRVNLQSGQTADFLTINNESDTDKAAFEISLKKWEQTGDDKDPLSLKDVLTDSDDILLSPKTVVLQPGKNKLVRIIVNNNDAVRKNYSYRLVITQLPSKDINSPQNTVNLLFKISLPIFAFTEESKTVDKMNVSKKLVVEGGKKYIVVTNNDNQHVQLQELSNGVEKININAYILPKNTKKFLVPENLSGNNKPLTLSSDKGILKFE